MNGWALLGIIMVMYCAFVIFTVIKKPKAIWDMKKVQTYIKVLGERGTEIVFVIFALIIGGLGIWMLFFK